MTTNIYVLKLEGNRYYVGKAQDPMRRYQEHMNGEGSAWTRRHPPLSLVETRTGVSPFEEDKVTKEYMAKYGIDKVRGGSYVTETLSDEQHDECRRAIRAASDCCTRCGRKGHFVASCHATTHVEGNTIEDAIEEEVWACETCDREFEDEDACERHERRCSRNSVSSNRNKCYRCGREGHYANTCYARTTVDREPLDSDSEEDGSEDESEYDSE